MKIGPGSSLAEVAQVVATALERAGIRAVLTGGACAAIHTRGEYASEDLDFLLRSLPSQNELDEAMAGIGFARKRDQYFHAGTRFFIEFPLGPLGIGRDLSIRPVRTRIHGRPPGIHTLSATDSCRDRLAAFYHWKDRESLAAAVQIALRNAVNMKRIRSWSAQEGASEGLEIFVRELAIARRRRKSRRSTS